MHATDSSDKSRALSPFPPIPHRSIGKLRLDLKHSYSSSSPPRPIPPLGPDTPDPTAVTPGNGWLTAADECSLYGPHAEWLFTGTSELQVQGDMLVEYDTRTRAPIGIVHKKARTCPFAEFRPLSAVHTLSFPPLPFFLANPVRVDSPQCVHCDRVFVLTFASFVPSVRFLACVRSWTAALSASSTATGSPATASRRATAQRPHGPTAPHRAPQPA